MGENQGREAMTETRLPPHDMNAEEALIGCLLLDGDLLDEIAVTPEDFYHAVLQTIFKSCLSLKERGIGINEITIAQDLNSTGCLEVTGGVAYLSQLISQVPTSLDAPDYADIVRNLSTQRRLIAIGEQIIEKGFNTQGDVVKKFDDCDKLLLDVRKRCAPPTLITPKERVSMMADRYADMATRDAPMALHTGLLDLDRQLGGGFYDGDFIVLGSRPSMGKTTLLLQLANHVALTKPVLFVSAEMPVVSLTDRDVAQIVKVPINVIRSGHWNDEINEKVTDALGTIAERKVYFYWQSGITTGRILQAAIGMQARYGLGAVFIDYMGLLADDQGLRSYERVTAISHRLNEMKLTLNVPIITAHQLSRDLEQQDRKTSRRPKLSDLRDSGAIEQDADIVLFLYRENYYDHEITDSTTEIIIAKQRQGGTGRIKFTYDKTQQLYQNIAQENYNGQAHLV
jgi:replicative DNA helicase